MEEDTRRRLERRIANQRTQLAHLESNLRGAWQLIGHRSAQQERYRKILEKLADEKNWSVCFDDFPLWIGEENEVKEMAQHALEG